MIALLRRLFRRKPLRHYLRKSSRWPALCACGYSSPWDYDLRRHFTEQERIGA